LTERRPWRRASVGCVASLAAWGWLATGAAAHKPITSPFTFYEDVLPITQERCGSCHAPDGIAPMSLLSHEAAVPWGESMRLELVAGHMPPGSDVSPRGRFQQDPPLTARELNVLLTWATGGTPSGDPGKAVPPASPTPSSPVGAPAETMRLPRVDLAANETSRIVEAVLPLGSRARALAAVDLQPGTRAVVRSARIVVRERVGGATTERLVGLWVPGGRVLRLPERAAWRVGPGADLVVQVAYRKRWDREREPVSDESVIALYDPDGTPAAEADAIDVRASATGNTGARLIAEAHLTRSMRLLGLWPDTAAAGASVHVDLVQGDGSRSLLAAFDARPGWERRFLLAVPEPLAAGTRIQVTAAWPSPARIPPAGSRLVGFDVVPAN
jgi:hypothetical protein